MGEVASQARVIAGTSASDGTQDAAGAGGLALERVSKSFGGVVAAHDVDLAIPPSRITGLIGPNGAGKTTIVNLITGMLPLSGGRIRLGDRDLSELPADEVARAGVARTFQNIRLLKEASVLDNVMIGFHRHERCSLLAGLLALPAARRESERVRAGARALLTRFDMERFADHPAGSLAYGHQRRVEMMRALGASPRVLLLDEPVAGMNDVEANTLGDIFRALADDGIAVLLIEHNMRFVTRLCDRVFVLDGGRVIASGTPHEVVADPVVVAAYLGS